jgi:hypothetical protein
LWRILREDSPGLRSRYRVNLAGALMGGKVDVAFLRREAQAPGLAIDIDVRLWRPFSDMA